MNKSMATNVSLVLLAVAVAACANHKKALPDVPPPAAEKKPDFAGRSPRMVSLDSLNIDISPGTHLGELKAGWVGSCTNPRPLTYKHGMVKLSTTNYRSMFKDVMQASGIPVEQPARFTGEEVKKADLNFAGTIQEMALNACFPQLGKDQSYAIGEAYLKVEWSVFSPVERKVVYSATTQGRSPTAFETRLADDGLIAEAMRDSLVRFLAQPGLEATLIAAPGGAAPATKKPAFANAPRLTGGLTKNMAQLRGSVVTVFANAGQGSGFAVGKGDRVLTAAHVVAGSKFVKMTTADDKHYYGEVVKSDAPRDLALIKLEQGQLKPLAIVAAVPEAGAEVYAIGSPLGNKFSMSVTKGVVSGMRTEDGQDYLQSDVSVLPGSSGGPLLDADGNVVGVTQGGLSLSGAPAGMNFFKPARDLLKFLDGN
jgi:serine protease Do